MSDSNVIPFRKRQPAEMELELYQRMTRSWQPDLKQIMFPEHFKREQQAKQA